MAKGAWKKALQCRQTIITFNVEGIIQIVIVSVRHICLLLLLIHHKACNITRWNEWWCIISVFSHALQTIDRALDIYEFSCVCVCVKACLSVGKRGKLMEFFSTILQNWMKIVIFKHFHLYLALLLLLLLSFFASSTSLALLPTTRSRLHWAICILLLYILCIW